MPSSQLMHVMKLSVWDTPSLIMPRTKVVVLLLQKGNLHMLHKWHDSKVPLFRFFEWKKLTEKKKIPYYTKRKDGKLMLFAGLYEHSNIDGMTNDGIMHISFWRVHHIGQSLYTCTIVTTSPSKFFSFLHDRMPVILENGSPEVEKWLSSEPWGKDMTNIMKPYEGELDW